MVNQRHLLDSHHHDREKDAGILYYQTGLGWRVRVLTAGTGISITDAGEPNGALTLAASLGTSIATAEIDNDAVTYAKMQNVSAASRLLGRGSAGGAGDVEEITLGSGLTMTATSLSASGGPTLDHKTADESATTDDTLSADTHLALVMAANDIWAFEYVLFIESASATPDFKFDFTIPAGASIKYSWTSMDQASTSGGADASDIAGTDMVVTLAAGELMVVNIKGVVVQGTNAGNLQLNWAQNVSDGTATTVYKGSYLIGNKLA